LVGLENRRRVPTSGKGRMQAGALMACAGSTAEARHRQPV